MSDELEEEDDGQYDESEELYEWCAIGESCAVCDALDGMTFTSPPGAVHPHCECEVRPAKRPPPQYTNCENKAEITGAHSEWSGGPPENHLVIHVEIEIECWDGTNVTDTVDVDYGDDPDIDIETFDDELWDAVSEHMEELTSIHCPECQATPVG